MEYIEHGDLAKLINESNMTESDAKVITRQLLEGLKVMHENNFCHRDLKPMVRILPTWHQSKDDRLNHNVEYPCGLTIPHCSQNQRLWHHKANRRQDSITNNGRDLRLYCTRSPKLSLLGNLGVYQRC